MFVRKELKTQAKEIIKRKYFVMVLICLIAAFLGSSIIDLDVNVEAETSIIYLFSWWPISVSYKKTLMMAFPLLIVTALWLIFVAYPIQVGVANYFKRATNDLEKFEEWTGKYAQIKQVDEFRKVMFDSIKQKMEENGIIIMLFMMIPIQKQL